MEIKQFYDDNLSHASYAVMSEKKIALIDPARDPKPYYDFAKDNNAEITSVIETHPHADFVSSHFEISKNTGAKIYVSRLVNPYYEFTPFDEGDELILGKIKLIPINTPGHSPDSICILIKDEDDNDYAIATGDTLFVGDVGRPDLRESAGSINKSKEELARMMYNSLTQKLSKFPDSIIVYPAHGGGSLCGKSTSTDTFTTIGREKRENYALQPMSEDQFVNVLLSDQSYIPAYFGYDVELNRRGAPDFEKSVRNVKKLSGYDEIEEGFFIVDARKQFKYAIGHYKNSINIPEDKKFETYLGTLIRPEEKFYLVGDTEDDIMRLTKRAAKIGYELNIKGVIVHMDNPLLKKSETIDPERLQNFQNEFTIIDVRNRSEVTEKKIFHNSISMPLNEINERYSELPLDKPIIVHCAAGTRSAAASSLLEILLNTKIYDLGEKIKLFSEISN